MKIRHFSLLASAAALLTIVDGGPVEAAKPPPPIYVDCTETQNGNGSKNSPFNTIQTGIDAAFSGDTVLVRDGICHEHGITFGGKAITVVSDSGPAGTTIDAQGLGTALLFEQGETGEAVLQGFTVTGGSAADGGGIRINASSPSITDCLVTGNSASNHGGGLYSTGYSSPVFTGCQFTQNTAVALGGGIYIAGGHHIFQDCSISNNSAQSGAGVMTVAGSQPDFLGCTVSGNIASYEGGGMYLYGSDSTTSQGTVISGNNATGKGGGIYEWNGSLSLIDSVVENNSGSSGGGIMAGHGITMRRTYVRGNEATNGNGGGLSISGTLQSEPLIVNSIFSGNKASGGGGIHITGLSAQIVNSTFSGNLAAVGGGINCWRNGTFYPVPLILNSILYGNSPDEIRDDGLCTIEVSDSASYQDPFFLNPLDASQAPTSGGDYHLDGNSPVIDLGADSSSYPEVPAGDIDGDTRDIPDLGADEVVVVTCNGDGVCDPDEDCLLCPGECAGKTGGRPSGRFCCGNGVPESAEGDGSICDGNW